MLDRFRWVIAYKLLVLNALTFLCIWAFAAALSLHPTCAVSDLLMFMLAGLLAPLGVSFLSDAHARSRFCSSNAVPIGNVGHFWQPALKLHQLVSLGLHRKQRRATATGSN